VQRLIEQLTSKRATWILVWAVIVPAAKGSKSVVVVVVVVVIRTPTEASTGVPVAVPLTSGMFEFAVVCLMSDTTKRS
jgi:hypothetical protein